MRSTFAPVLASFFFFLTDSLPRCRYVGMLLEDAGISTDLIVTPGQTVSVSGDRSLAQPPLWGSGGFTVQERGSLAVTYMAGAGHLTVLGGGTASLSGCTGQLTGLSVTDSTFSMDTSSTATLGGSISLTNAGAVTLQGKTFVDGTRLTVGGGTQLSLSGCMLGSSTITVNSGGSLSLASMAVPAAVLGAAVRQLSGAGSTLRLAAVTLPEALDAGEFTGTMTVQPDGSQTTDPPSFGVTTAF